MNRRYAQAISVLFHPVFVNALSLYMFFVFYPPLRYGLHPRLQLFYMALVFVTTGAIPILFVLISRLFGRITSFFMHDKEERNLPYVLTACTYLFDFYIARSSQLPAPFCAYLLACSAIITVVLIVNQFTKISIHATSLGALIGVICAIHAVSITDMRWVILVFALLTGLVMTARLALKAHEPYQLYSGFGVGLVLMWVML